MFDNVRDYIRKSYDLPLIGRVCRRLERLVHGKRLRRYEIDSVYEYCKRHGYRVDIVEPEKERMVYKPEFFGQSFGEEFFYKSSVIYVAELSDVYAVGCTGVILSGKVLLSDELKSNEERYKLTYGPLKSYNNRIAILETTNKIKEIDSAINLCGFASENYYHFTMEILSRYSYIDRMIDDKDVPVLIDDSVCRYPQMVELLKTVIYNRHVIFLKYSERARVGKLYYPSMNTWLPINVKSREDFKVSDNLIAGSGVYNIRDAAKELIEKQTERKVFISRKNTKNSRIVNEEEVVKLFHERGYEIVCTEMLSYKEQIELFSTARCIVGASGAAMTNLIYCNKGTVFGCLISEESRFYIYSTIAHLVGLITLFMDLEVFEKSSITSGDRLRVDIDECDKYISKLDSMCENRKNG